MKRIRITLLTTFVALTLILIQAGTSAAYQLEWKVIQHRVYESGGSLNRLAFEITDDSGNYVSSANVVTGVVLKAPMFFLFYYKRLITIVSKTISTLTHKLQMLQSNYKKVSF